MALTTTIPLAGVDLVNTKLAADIANPGPPFVLGTQVFGNDGKLYVFAKANAAISAATAVCTVSASTFLATATGGTYTSPNTAMAVGDVGWFSKASV